jgi:uncharacterized protein YgbK (DUF1537 family)
VTETAPDEPVFVIDDDPTGAQAQENVPLLLSWAPELVEAALGDRPRALHLLTNSRALGADAAYAVVREAAEAAIAARPGSQLVLRGDSTLRGHLLPEYLGVRDALELGADPPLLLVPALPAAGRVTRAGRHWLLRDGMRIPVDETEFAADASFSYESSRLLDWAQERSGGFFSAADGFEVDAEAIRSEDGTERVALALLAAAKGSGPAVVVPDAENESDLGTIADGLRRAWVDRPEIIVRCAPAFASVLSRAGATKPVTVPRVARGLLVVVGSHLPLSTAQLAVLDAEHPDAMVELDASILARGGPAIGLGEAIERARELLERTRLAIVATTRAVVPEALDFEAGMRVARALADVVAALRGANDVLLSKGGITSAVNVGEGLHADRVLVVGPVASGISLWHAFEPDGGRRAVIVFPGNVGDEAALARLVDRLLER